MENSVCYRRILAHIIFEADTPLSIGSGNENPMTDALIATDVNGFPYIPGTTLAGLLRHSLQDASFFGEHGEGDDGFGSRIIFTEAKITDLDSVVVEAYRDVPDEFRSELMSLPIRQHVRIGHTGTGVDKGKYDGQILYKGTRFCFDMEMIVSSDEDYGRFKGVLDTLRSPYFRIGGGSRSGFGKIKIVKILEKHLDLSKTDDLREYLDMSPRLDKDYTGWKELDKECVKGNGEWIRYELQLTPDDFFLFGSGIADKHVDDTPVREKYISWDGDKGSFREARILIPATSVKGAIAHRTAYHFNKISEIYSDRIELEDFDRHTGQFNEAVCAIFGAWKTSLDRTSDDGSKSRTEAMRGKVMFSDIFRDDSETKVLNHVKIDRFTGGTIDGALFSEEVTETEEKFRMEIFLSKEVKEEYAECFESALKDIAQGRLPLGGGSGRGHGFFSGKVCKDGVELK